MSITPVRNLSIPTLLAGKKYETSRRSLLYTLFTAGLKTEAAIFFLLKTINSGSFKAFHPVFGKEEADRRFTGILAKVHLTDHPDKMTSLAAWQHMLNNAACNILGNRSILLAGGMTAAERRETTAVFRRSVEDLKVIEAWIYHHQEKLSFISQRGEVLLPDLHGPQKPEVIRKILVVENDSMWIPLAKRSLRGRDVEVASLDPAGPLKPQIDGLIGRQFDGTDMILLDGLSTHNPNGQTVVKLLRESGYKNHIVATDADDYENSQMAEVRPGGVDFCIPGKDYLNFPLFVQQKDLCK